MSGLAYAQNARTSFKLDTAKAYLKTKIVFSDSGRFENTLYSTFIGIGTSASANNKLLFSNHTATNGLGLLIGQSSADYVNVPTGQGRSLIELTKGNLQDTTGVSEYIGIRITTADSCIDCGEAISLRNKGRADAMYIGVEGVPINPPNNTPTGIGMDLNRNGSGENSTTFTGYGIQIYDWSSTNIGNGAGNSPTGIYLLKKNNPNTTHNLLQMQANTHAIELYQPGGGSGYDETLPLINFDTAGYAKWQILSSGYETFHNNLGIHFGSLSGNVGQLKMNTSNQLDMIGGSSGWRVLNNAGTSANLSMTDAGVLTARDDFVFPNNKGLYWNMTSGNQGYTIGNGTTMFFRGGTSGYAWRNNADNTSIVTLSDAGVFSILNKFQVDANGNIVKLNNVTTSFPSSNSAGVLTNNGSGTYSIVAQRDTMSKGWTFDGGSAPDSTIFWIVDQSGLTVDSIFIYREGGTSSSFNVVKISGGSASDLISANYATNARTWLQRHENVGALQNNSLAKGDKLGFVVRAVSGTVTRYLIQIVFSKNQL